MVRRRLRYWSSSTIGREGRPRNSVTRTSRRPAELVSRIRARSPFSPSNRGTRPFHSTNSPDRSSRQSAESDGSVFVSPLRAFGHQLLTRDAFGHELLTCSVHNWWCTLFPGMDRIAEVSERDLELTRNCADCTFGQKLKFLDRDS